MRSGKSARWAILPVCTMFAFTLAHDAQAQGKMGQKKGDGLRTPLQVNGEPVLLEGFRAKKEPVRAGGSSNSARGGIGTNCCTTAEGPGCEDAAIEACVCAADAFCCATDWDGVCVDQVDSLGCGTCLAPLTNDDCVDAIALPGDGSFPFSNAGATNDGPALPALCDEGFGLGKGADIWYTLTAVCDSPITISLCDADYDARMSVYNDDTCPATNADFETCDDDGCGAIGGPSEVTFNGVAGTTYLIRIGGFAGGDGIGDTGSGNIVITGAGSGVATDCNSNSVPDSCETDETTDCDGNGTLDECELGSLPDCNTNGTPDACETDNDCNDNGTPDDCDIAGGTSSDADGGGTPDECEDDCNDNGVPDGLDIANGTSADCQPDGVPDECQLGITLRGLDPTDSVFCQQGIQDDNGVGGGLLLASGSSAPQGFISAENVTPTENANINRVDWQVVYFGGASDCPGADGVDISIFSSVGGAPGALLASYTDVPNSKNLAARAPLLGTNPVYDATATLDPPFAVAAGTEIWISIVGDSSVGGCAGTYGWVVSDEVPPGDSESFQDTTGGGFVSQDADLAICVFSGGGGADCNGNGVPDDCDIADGADDCNSNSTPDECEIIDCDNNTIFDECEILADPSLDLAGDADGSECGEPDGVLDVCQDCNNNGAADCSDLLPGTDNVKDEFVSGLGVPIPDCDTATDQPVTNSIVFTECGSVDDLDVAFQADHTFVGDFIVTLEHEDTGTTVTLMHRVNANNAPTCANGGSAAPFGNGNDNVDVIFDDEAAAPIETQAGSLANGESFRPSAEAGEAQFSTLLSDFDGEDKCGTWTISVLDNGAADTGTFQGWGLIFTNGGAIPPFSEDCNTNGTPDECDVAAGTSDDCNGNIIPDECEDDCNDNGRPDDCDTLAGQAPCTHTIDLVDSFGDGWDGASISVLVNGGVVLNNVTATGFGTSFDFTASTGDAITTQYTSGSFENEHTYDIVDGNGNVIASDGPFPGAGVSATGKCGSEDCDGNSVPDECEPDCNQNGATDACDILSGDSDDCNKDGVPDECSGSPGGLKITDIAANEPIPDTCPGAAECDGPFACSTFTVDESGIIDDVDIGAQISHTFIRDLIVKVSHNGTEVIMWDRQCVGEDNLDVIFDDEGDGGVACGALSGGVHITSVNPLSAFDGMDKQGEWEFCVSDNQGQDVGQIDTWSLQITNQASADSGLIDCNENGLLDECDILFGLSEDCNTDEVPDECQPCVEETFANEDFCEGLPAGWSVSGSAHVTDACAQPDPCDECEGTQQWVYFGRDAVCQKADAGDGQVGGVLTSPPIDITGFTTVNLEYCSIYNGERGQAPGGIDAAWVAVNGTIVDDVGFLNQNVDVWETRQIDLTPFVPDGVVTITWHFDTADSINNAFLGWQVDQISIDGDDTDCNDNGEIDQCDVRDGFSFDFNKNFCPDECEDCNGNGVLDDADVQPGQVKFYQNNFPAGLAIPDADSSGVVSVINVAELGPVVDLDLALEIEHTNNGDLEVTLEHLGVSATLISSPGGGANDNDGLDVNLNDEAQASIATADSGGGVLTGQFRPSPDALSVFDGLPKSNDWVLTVRDLSGGNVGQILSWQLRMANAPPFSDDCNFNGTPDECEEDDDCNNNSTLDACELADNDCNADGIPDDCQLDGNDCNVNGTPDDCEVDCDSNGSPDDCDIAGGADDCNNNGTPDVCESGAVAVDTLNASPGVAVPDNDAAGVTSIINVPDSANVVDVNVGLNVTHTFFGDFCVTLTHPSGSPTVQLIARPGADNGVDDCHSGSPFGCSSNEWALELDDEGGDGAIEDNCGAGTGDPTPSGAFTPFEALDAFDGLDAAGDWTITVSDNGGGDTGVFNSWSLTLSTSSETDCNNNGTLDECDIAGGTSTDDNNNDTPDECEAPDNDDCGSAIEVFSGVQFDGSSAASTGSDISSCAFNDELDVWHSWTADCDGDATFSLCGSGFDTTLAVYDGCGGAELACNDDFFSVCGSGNHSHIDAVPVTSGTTYWIRVSGFNGATGDYSLNVSCSPSVTSNDECVDATEVFDGSNAVDLTVGTTNTLDEPSCGFPFGDDDIHQDVWFTYQATCTGDLFLDMCDGDNNDTRLAIYDGVSCPPSADPLECNDDHGNATEADSGVACTHSLASALSVPVTSGNFYTVRVGTFNDFSTAGNEVLRIGCGVAPPPLAPALGDFDNDGDFDLRDFAELQACSSSFGTACEVFDIDSSNAVDVMDFKKLEPLFVGPQSTQK